MFDPNVLGLPFPVRDMFTFGPGTVFELEVNVWTTLTNPLLLTGATRDNAFTLRVEPTGNFDQETFVYELSDMPVFLSLNDNDQYNVDGTIWVEVFLRINKARVLKLMSGYVTTQRALTWPAYQGPNPSQELPLPNWVTSTNPAAGANQSDTPGSSQYWVVHAVALRLVTDGNAANRRVHLRVEDNGGKVISEWWGNTDQAANTTKDYVFTGTGAIQSETDNGIIAVAIATPIYLTGNMVLKTSITNIQVGDQISNTRYLVSQMAKKP